MIYFDSTATTKPSDEILELYERISKEYWYNSETLYREGSRSNALYIKSKDVILSSLNLKGFDVLFTSSATEANNTAIFGYLNNYKNKHIITTYLEHASVLKVYQELEKQGFKVTYLKPKDDGSIDPMDIKNSITNDTILISVMWVNNIIGSIQPIKEIIDILKDHPKIKLHVDAVQGFGKIQPDFNFNDVDFLTISGHKLHGMKGTGLLVYKKNINLNFMRGGHGQGGLRPGTVDIAGCVCMAKVIQLNSKINLDTYKDINEKYLYLVNKLKTYPQLMVITPKIYSPYILNINFNNLRGETALHMLEADDIIVGTGSACNSSSEEAEPTLKYLLNETRKPINSIRISLDEDKTYEDLDKLLNSLKKVGI